MSITTNDAVNIMADIKNLRSISRMFCHKRYVFEMLRPATFYYIVKYAAKYHVNLIFS